MLLQGNIQNTPKLWMRRCKLIVVFENEQGLNFSDFRIRFHVRKNLLLSNQVGEIIIYNLNSDTEKQILSQAVKVYLEAGYYDDINYGQIYCGDVYDTLRGTEDGVNKFIKLKCISDDDSMNWGITSFNIRRGTNYRDLLQYVAVNSEPQLTVGELPENWGEEKLQRALSLFDSTKTVLKDIGKSQNSIIKINNGQIDVISLAEKANPETAFLMNKQTGMLSALQTFDGVEVNSLLIPQIKLGGWLAVNNKDIQETETEIGQLWNELDYDGLYRVISQEFIGDTHGNEWNIKHSCITQAGSLPVMLQEPNQNGI